MVQAEVERVEDGGEIRSQENENYMVDFQVSR